MGPAIIVAAVVLGPGSILTSSKVGSSFGLIGFPVVIVAAILMIAMVALSARLGAIYENSLCDEIASRLGRPVAVFIGLTLFTLVALFQSSNNIALIGGVEPLFGAEPFSFRARAVTLAIANLLIIASLYLVRNLYKSIEGFMKLLMGLMTAAFLVNFVVVMSQPQSFEPVTPTGDLDWIPLLGMIGTTFSVGGAFYQAYLVKEKGWGLADVRAGVIDSIFSITLLGIVTSIVLLTSWRVFYGHPTPVTLESVGDVARQLEPSFGKTAKVIFCSGILAGALSSFLVNALIGGTVMSDSIGKGSRLQDKWPVHLTVVALLVGMFVAIAALQNKDSVVPLITLAQACTVIGLPALAGALIYLGTRPELTGPRRVPTSIMGLAIIGFCVSCVLMLMLGQKVYAKLYPPPAAAAAHQPATLPDRFPRAQSVLVSMTNASLQNEPVATLTTSHANDAALPLIASISKETLWSNRDGKSQTWFHPRACMLPDKNGKPVALMNLQVIGGSDYFGPVHWTISEDLGKTWSDPKPITALGRDAVSGRSDDLKAAVCDVTPQYHAATNTIIALGHVVFYKGEYFARKEQLARYPVYVCRSSDGTWSPRKILKWDDPRGSNIYSNNCGQRIVLPNGDIQMSFTFGPEETHRMVAGVQATFDGHELLVKEVGDPIHNPKGRGLLEPSVTQFGHSFWITMRAEDNRGYVSVSSDGLHWADKKPWTWEDGTPLDMSTTQQHWLTHSDGLFLVYTRKDTTNENVIRWRSPLWVAQVNLEKQCLIKSTEQVVLPLVGDGVNDPSNVALMGNFSVTNASPNESWITVGEWMPKAGYKGDVLLARIHWNKPNRLPLW